MKKFFTLITMAVMAVSAMAQESKTYTDNLSVTVSGMTNDSQASITITKQTEADKYTIQLNQFSFMGMLVGDVTMTDVNGTTDADGFTNFSTTQEATITNGADLMEMLGGKVNVTVKEGTRCKGEKFYALISLTVTGFGDINATFGDNNFDTDGINKTTTTEGDKVAAIYTLGGQRINTPARGVNIIKMKSGKTVKVVNKY